MAVSSFRAHSPTIPLYFRILIPVVLVAICTVAALGLGKISLEAPFLIFLPAVLISLWFAGFRASLCSIILSTVAVDYFFVPPYKTILLNREELFRGGLFVLSMAIAVLLFERHQKRAGKAIALRDKLLDESPEPILITDFDHRVVYWNRGAKKLYGWSSEEALGKKPKELLQTKYPYSEIRIEEELNRTGSWRGKLIRTRSDGTEVITDSSWTIDRESGFILQTDLDMTARFAAEKTAEKNAQMLSAAIESMMDSFFIVDRDYRLLHFNEAFSNLIGFQKKEDCPLQLTETEQTLEFFHPDGSPARRGERPVALALQGVKESQRYYRLVRRLTGDDVTASYTFGPLRSTDGDIVGAVVSIRDVTQRQEMERQLKRLNRALTAISKVNQLLTKSLVLEESALFQRTVDIICNEGGYPLVWIGVAEQNESQRIRVAAVCGSGADYVSSVKITARDEPEGRGPLGTALRENRTVVIRDVNSDPNFALWRGSAEKYSFRSVISLPVSVEGKAVAGLTVYAHEPHGFDSDERRLLEELAGDLAVGLVSIRNQKLAEEEREARVQLENQLRQAQKLEAVGTLAGGIAHDFNNLLMVIMGQMELLSRDLNGQMLKRAESVMQSAKRGSDLTCQLLAFSRKQITQPVVTSFNLIIENFIDVTHRLIGENIEIKVALHDEPWCVRVDRSQFEQVILNLVVNARDAMPNGGQLTIETDNCILTDEYIKSHPLVPPGKYSLLAVTDTGIGMTQEIQARVFEPFFTTKDVGKGTGLGLATVYGIVKQANGFVWVYSEPGKGSCFKIYIPVSSEFGDAYPAERPRTEHEYSAIKATILLVEDDPNLRRIISEFMQEAGHNVLAAASPKQAYALASEFRDDLELILCDVVLRGGNGKHLVEGIQKLGCKCRVIYMSGYTPNAIVHHGVLDPGVQFLQKPFSRDALLKKIEEVLLQD